MKFKLLFLIFFLPLFPLISHEEIRVHLSTNSPLVPLYLGAFSKQGEGISQEALKQLEEVLAYDLKYCGYISLLQKDPKKEARLQMPENNNAFQSGVWKEWGAAFALRAVLRDHALQVALFDVQKQTLKQFSGVPLTGELAKDRKALHRLSDAIVKTLFNVEGIASTHLLYSKYVQEQGTWVSEIWVCDWDGANARMVTQDHSYSVSPQFVPTQGSSDHFFYVSYQLGQPKVYFCSLLSGKRTRALSLKGNQLLPTISKQKDRIAFISDAAGRPDLYIQKLTPSGKEEGKAIPLFSFRNSTQASPTFSPDGKKLAFVSDKEGRPRIYLIDATAQTERPVAKLLTSNTSESTCPQWSFDGQKIAYSAQTEGIRQIWIYDFATGEEKQLTFGPTNKENPHWAPDSLHLVFNSTDADSSELFVVNIHQNDAVKITRGVGKKHYPAWGK